MFRRVIILFMISFATFSCKENSLQNDFNIEETTRIRKLNKINESSIDRNNYYIIVDDYDISESNTPSTIPKKYILDSEINSLGKIMSLKKYDSAYNNIIGDSIDETNYIRVYNFKNTKKVKDINVKEIVKKKYSNLFVSKKVFIPYRKNNKNYVSVLLSTKITSVESRKKLKRYLLEIDIDNPNDYRLINNVKDISTNSKMNNTIQLLYLTNFLKVNDLDDVFIEYIYTGDESNYIKIDIPSNKLPKKNKKLYNTFPKLKNVKAKDKRMVSLYIKDSLNATEIISYLTEGGKEPNFNGVIYDDDKDLPIRNESEFEKIHRR